MYIRAMMKAISENVDDIYTKTMLLDAIQDENDPDNILHAVQWAVKEGYWPFTRRDRIDCKILVYDWEGDHRPSSFYRNRETQDIPSHARLPADLYRRIKSLPNRTYSDEYQAFILLARAMELVGPPRN